MDRDSDGGVRVSDGGYTRFPSSESERISKGREYYFGLLHDSCRRDPRLVGLSKTTPEATHGQASLSSPGQAEAYPTG